jgi:trypsin
MTYRHVIALLAALITLFAVQHARAISREQDVIRDLNPLFAAPSTYPPNAAVRPSELLNSDRVNRSGPSRLRPPDLLRSDSHATEDAEPDHVPARAYPFVVALATSERSPQEGFVCAGALIARRWVLTAAHCVFNLARRWPVDSALYVLTDTSRLAEPGPKFAVLRIVVHPQFDPRTLKNDVALLQIAAGDQSAPLTPIQLEGPPPRDQVGEIANIFGWGITNASIAVRQNVESLQLLQVAVRGKICFTAANFPQLKDSGIFCASSLLNFHDTCYRFGGGPIVLYDQAGNRYLAGIVSWAARCPPETDRVTAYTDVQFYVPWIKGAIQANGGDRP